MPHIRLGCFSLFFLLVLPHCADAPPDDQPSEADATDVRRRQIDGGTADAGEPDQADAQRDAEVAQTDSREGDAGGDLDVTEESSDVTEEPSDVTEEPSDVTEEPTVDVTDAAPNDPDVSELADGTEEPDVDTGCTPLPDYSTIEGELTVDSPAVASTQLI